MEDETTGEKLERLRSRLTVQQREFCERYLVTLDEAQAYEEAYGTKRGRSAASRLLGRWYIRDYLAALTEASSVEELLVTKEEVLATLAGIMRNFSSEDKDRIQAARTIAQVRGFAVKKVQHSGDVKVRREGLTKEEIARVRAEFLGIDVEDYNKADSQQTDPDG